MDKAICFTEYEFTLNTTGTAVRSEAWVCGRSIAIAKLCLSCERCVLSGTGVCDGQITRPEDLTECVCVCVPSSVVRPYNNPLHLQWVGKEVIMTKNMTHTM
jgi:hypothetical protein